MGARITILDGRSDLARLVARLLTKEGFDASVAETSDALMASVRQSCPDIILLDAQLPNTDGFTLCQKLRKQAADPSVRLVLMTARSLTTDREKGAALGADAVLPKPFDLQALITALPRADGGTA